MSWADDIRCLFCDGKLPLYRKITDGQFCSAAHRKAYWQEHERLAVERLLQTHDSLRAYRPPGSLQAILGLPEVEEEVPPAPGRFVDPGLTFQRLAPPQVLAADPFAYEDTPQPERPSWDVPPVSATGRIPLADPLPFAALTGFEWLADRIATVDPEPLGWTTVSISPARAPALRDPLIDPAGQVEMPLAGRITASVPPGSSAGGIAPKELAAHPVIPPTLGVSPRNEELQRLLDEPVACCENLHPIPRPLAQAGSGWHCIGGNQAAPIAIAGAGQLPLDTLRPRAGLAPAALAPAGMHRLPIERAALVPGAWIDHLRALDIRSDAEAPQLTLATPASRPRLRLAAGSRYAVATRESAVVAAEPQPSGFSTVPPNVSLPERGAMAASPANVSAGPKQPVEAPELARRVPLTLAAAGRKPKACSAQLPPFPQPLGTEPIRPASKLQPLDGKPADSAAPSSSVHLPTGRMAPVSLHGTPMWGPAVDFWRNAPRDLKTLVFAIPVLLGLALHPSLPKVRVTAPADAKGIQRELQRTLSAQLTNVRQTVVDRAAVALDEDFRSGLDDWVSRGDATTEWSYDANGFVRPGPLAMYRPSLGLTDYQLQFLGMIDKNALSWVVRAADFRNYYVVKLVVLKPGPLPTIGVTRYAVIDGKAEGRVDTVAPIDARQDMLYRVRLDVHGDTFVLDLQGQIADVWSEPRLKHGGIGFFTARGEESRLRWVQVTHQYDTLGRLCAYLAPYNITSTNGGWEQ